MRKLVFSIGLLFLVGGASAETEIDSITNLAGELVKIRHEIETLHSKISFEKDTFKDQVRSYSSQKSDLEVRIGRADTNIKDLQRELKKLVEQKSETTRSHDQITPVLKDAIAGLRKTVSGSLPFKREQRLNALHEIEHRLDSGIVTPNRAANQLWAFVEDELMLGKGSGIYNDTLSIGGQDKLVKVLRIGKIAMFYKTSDDHFGVVAKEGGAWTQRPIEEPKNVAQLGKFFDSFNRNIHNGQFTMPNFLPKN